MWQQSPPGGACRIDQSVLPIIYSNKAARAAAAGSSCAARTRGPTVAAFKSLRLAASSGSSVKKPSLRCDGLPVRFDIIEGAEPSPEAMRANRVEHAVGGIFEQHILLMLRRRAAMGDELQPFLAFEEGRLGGLGGELDPAAAGRCSVPSAAGSGRAAKAGLHASRRPGQRARASRAALYAASTGSRQRRRSGRARSP